MSRARGLIAVAAAGVTAAGAARLAYAAAEPAAAGRDQDLVAHQSPGRAGHPARGPPVAVGAIVGALAQAGLRSVTGSAGPAGPAGALAVAAAGAGAAAFGAYDDLAGSGDRRGFRGHLGALRNREVTTGTVKLGGIGVTGIVSAVLAGGSPADVVINAGLVAGGANLLNLFDLRPGRAIKVAVASGALIGAGGTRTGRGAPRSRRLWRRPWRRLWRLLPEDLRERAMLGDCGANALGAMLGAAAVGLPRPARITLLAGITGLTAASEKVSFTKVIERTPPLRLAGHAGPAPGRSGARRTDSRPARGSGDLRGRCHHAPFG